MTLPILPACARPPRGRDGVPCRAASALAIGLAVAASACAAAEDGGGRSVFAFGAGNRALSLGGAYAAVADDASAAVWNPGGLGMVTRRQLQASYTNLFGFGFSEQYASFVMPSWRWGATSLTLRNLGTSQIEGRDDRNVLLDETLLSRETEITLAYGRQMGAAWGIGGGVKLQQQSLAGYSDSGLGLDLGLLVRPLVAAGHDAEWASDVAVGLAIRNVVEPTIRLDEDAVSDPTGVRIGFAVRRPFRGGVAMLAALDVEKTTDMNARLHAGLEVRPMSLIALRAGLNDGLPEAGTGIRWRDVSIDYVFEDNPLGTIHRFGVDIVFGPTTEESRQAHFAREEQRTQERLAQAFEERNRQRVRGLIDQARDAIDAKRHDEALEILSMLKVLDPEEPSVGELQVVALRGKALELEHGEDFAAAAVTLGQALSLDPNDDLATEALARVRRESDRHNERSAEIRRLFESGLDAFAAGDLVSAREAFAQVADADRNDREALAMLRRAEDSIHLRASNLVEQARAMAKAGLPTDAEAALREARGLDPDSAGLDEVNLAIAEMWRRQREAEARTRAEAAARAVASDGPPPDTAPEAIGAPAVRALGESERREIEDLYRRGIAAVEEGRVDDAIRYWELVWSADPAHQRVREYLRREYLTRGMEAFASGRLQSAIADWESALSIDPSDERAKGYLERAHQQLTRYQKIVGETRVAVRE